MTAMRKHLVDVLAILGLIVVALAVAGVILANQRMTLPGWFPVLGWFSPLEFVPGAAEQAAVIAAMASSARYGRR